MSYFTDSRFGERRITMAKSRLKLVTPDTENRTVMPIRQPNSAYRTREYLTDAEVARLQEAAKGNRWGHRDATMIVIALPPWLPCGRAG